MGEERQVRPERAGDAPLLISSRRRGRRAARIEQRDFRRPAAPAGGLLRELEQFAGRLAARLGAALANYLKTAVAPEPAPPDVLQYDSAVAEAPPGTWFVPLRTPAGERAVLSFDPALQSYLIGRLLGWSAGQQQEQPQEQEGAAARPATGSIGEVSRAALGPFLASVLREVNQLFYDRRACVANGPGGPANGAEANRPARDGETRDPFAVDETRRGLPGPRMLRSGDSVFRFGVHLSEGDAGGCLGLLVLHRTFASLLAGHAEAPQRVQDPRARARLERVVRNLHITLSASLGSATVGLAEFLNLEPGNVLVLDRKVREPLDVRVGALQRFTAQPGRSGGRLAVRILGCMEHKESP